MGSLIASVNAKARLAVKLLFAGVLFRYYPISLDPLALHHWVDEVIRTRDIEGACLEIGVNLGGTSVFTKQVMNSLHIDKPYVCYDTFSGFVEHQAETDISRGMTRRLSGGFSANSERLVRRIFDIHGVADIITIKGDISQQDRFPRQVSACLIDVDLSEPTYDALQKVFPRLSDGGVILVDDCLDPTAIEAGGGAQRKASSDLPSRPGCRCRIGTGSRSSGRGMRRVNRPGQSPDARPPRPR